MPRLTDDEMILKMLKEGKLQKEIAQHFGVSPAAISKRVKKLMPEPESFKNLTEKEKKFVVAKARGRTQTQAVLDSYEVSSRATAKSMGSELMRREEIKIAVAELMYQEGLGKRSRVRKLKEHIYHPDPNVSLKALDQSWKLDGAYGEKPHVEVNIVEIKAELQARLDSTQQQLEDLAKRAGMTVEELRRAVRERQERNIIEAVAVGSS